MYNLNYVNPHYKDELKRVLSRNFISHQAIGYTSYENAVILPSEYPRKGDIGGVFDEQGNLLLQSTLHEGFPKRKIDVRNIDCKNSDEVVIFLGTFHSIWGHALTDSLKKIWFLETDFAKELISSGAKLVYIFLENSDNYTTKILELAGIEARLLVEIKEPIRFQKVYLPENSILYDKRKDSRLYTNEYKHTIDKLLQLLDSKQRTCNYPTFEKVYFSRKHIFQNGREWGESVIENCFKNLGYHIVYPEMLPMEEQFYILRNCKSFATTEGSISHNVLFCKRNTDVIIVRKVNRINYHQLILNEIAGVNVTFIDANCSYVFDEKMPLDGPFYLCKNKLLESFCDVRIKCYPLRLKPSYWWYCMTRYKIVRKFLYNRNIVHKIERLIWKWNI